MCFSAVTNKRSYSNLPNCLWQITYCIPQWVLQKSVYANVHNYTHSKRAFKNDICSIICKSFHTRYIPPDVGTFKCTSLAFYYRAVAQLHSWSTRIAKVTVWPKKPLAAIGSTDNKSATTEDPWGALKKHHQHHVSDETSLKTQLKFPSHRNHSSTFMH